MIFVQDGIEQLCMTTAARRCSALAEAVSDWSWMRTSSPQHSCVETTHDYRKRRLRCPCMRHVPPGAGVPRAWERSNRTLPCRTAQQPMYGNKQDTNTLLQHPTQRPTSHTASINPGSLATRAADHGARLARAAKILRHDNAPRAPASRALSDGRGQCGFTSRSAGVGVNVDDDDRDAAPCDACSELEACRRTRRAMSVRTPICGVGARATRAPRVASWMFEVVNG